MLRLLLSSLSSLLFLLYANSVYALDVLIYHNNYAYTDTKAGLEAQGHTVTGSTSTTTASASTLANYDVVFDQLYNNNCGANCRGSYDTYVKNGGTLVIVGENTNSFSSRDSNIVSLIENKFGGTLDFGSDVYGGTFYTGGTNNTVNTSISGADDGGQYIYGASIASTSDGTWVAKTSSGAVIWMMWRGSSLPSGYTGSVIVTFDINQFQGSYDSNATWEFFDDVIYYGINGSIQSSGSSSATPVYSSGITAAQSTKRTSKLNDTATHGMEAHIDIDGNSNQVDVDQHDAAHYLELTIIGNSNIVDIDQDDASGVATHFADVIVDGNSNDLDLLQTGSGNKTAFIGIDGNSNTVDVIQKDSGQHYLQLDLIGNDHSATITQEGSGSHDATVELTNGGGAWDFNLNQKGTTNKEYSLPHDMSDGSTTSGTCYVAAGCSLTVIQDD